MRNARTAYLKSPSKSIPYGIALLILTALAGCNPTQVQNAGIRTDGTSADANMQGKAYVYLDDPLAVAGKDVGSNVDMGRYLASEPKQITPAGRTSLTNDCNFQADIYGVGLLGYTYTDCLTVAKNDDPTTVPLQPVNGTWEFSANTSAFYQVNAMYHAKLVTERVMGMLDFIHERLHVAGSKSLPPSLPYSIADMGTWWFKYATGTSLMTRTAQLKVLSQSTLADNAYYDPAMNEVSLGYLSKYSKVFMVQDPSVIYHEMGHAFMTIFLNTRNAEYIAGTWQPLAYQAFPYYGAYSELGAMGEGIADYFAYSMNARTTFGEWALGRFLKASRPLTEDNALHPPGVSSAVDERLSYPEYLLYVPQAPTDRYEDVHNAGMITSHFLVAMTESLKTECLMNQETAVNHIMLLMAESFSFLGDLTGRGSDYNNTDDGTGKPRALVNLHKSAAYSWYYMNRQVTMRRFFQTFARNSYHILTRDACPNFTKEKLEQLLDMYGLLLFKHYDDNGTFSSSSSTLATREDSYIMASPAGLKNSLVSGIVASVFGPYFPNSATVGYPNTTAPTSVDEANRLKTVLVPKSSLAFTGGTASASLILDDSQSFGQQVATSTLFEGRVISPTPGVAGWEYNNNNFRVSPGELVGLVLNLTNSAGTAIGGVTVLATPWAHMLVTDTVNGRAKPCTINSFPSTSEGGLPATTCTDSAILPSDGARFKKPTAGTWPSKALHPVCLVQSSNASETRWVSQDDYRRDVLQIEDQDCLGYGTPDFAPAECLMRFLPGKDMAFLSRIDPQTSYYRTLLPTTATSAQAANFSFRGSAGLALEVNKWIPPGTIFTCRLRVQFSNCSDCFQSAAGEDEYTDIEYGGAKPFRVFDVGLTILD